MKENRKPLPWEPSETYTNETPGERDIRRMESELRELDILLKKSGI